MTSEEWKKGLEEHCTVVRTAYDNMKRHVDELTTVSDIDSIDMDEFLAVFQVRMHRLKKDISS